MQSFLDGELYDAPKCAQLSKQIADVIKARVKELEMKRHKLMCAVVIAQCGGQAIHHVSRCLWDPDADGQASATFKNNSLIASATVFAVYYE